MGTIGIIGAMEVEVKELKEQMQITRQLTKAGMEFCEGILEGQDVVVVRSGVGKVNAAVCTQILIDDFDAEVVINTGIAGSLNADINIGDLVISTDLGSALIYFMTYLIMLYVATRDWKWLALGFGAFVVAAVAAYFLFAHVSVRVEIWKDPFSVYEGSGYQVAQALFAIAAGGWFGTGLYQGSPTEIPYVDQDFMFAAIAEEMGSIFCICTILICMSCFIMFVNIAMKMTKNFYRYVALGLACTYAIQVFLTIGGSMKMIPMTGVTLPFVSSGGSSMLSTLIMFSVIQGLYILRKDEDDSFEDEEYYEEPQNYR